MKNIFLLLTFLLNTHSLSAFALTSPDIGVAKSIFWQAPYKTNIQLSLSAMDKTIADECTAHKKRMYSSDGSLNFTSSDRIDFYRRLPSDSSMDQFYSVLYSINGSLSETTNDTPEPLLSKLPYYNQTTTQTEFDLTTLNSIKVVYEKGSLLETSVAVGLSPLPIVLVYKFGKPYLKIQGRDTVCDLLEQKVKIQAIGTGNVHLPIKVQTSLNDYYANIESQTLNILSQDESSQSKTVRLGFRLSSIINPRADYNKDTEEATLALFKLLFAENSLELSNAWTKDLGGKPVLMPFGTSVKEAIQVELVSEANK